MIIIINISVPFPPLLSGVFVRHSINEQGRRPETVFEVKLVFFTTGPVGFTTRVPLARAPPR